MVENSRQKLIDTIGAFREMQGCLHWWDSLYGVIGNEVKRVEEVLHQNAIQNAIAPDVVEYFAQRRDELRRLTFGEIYDNVDNLEIGEVALKTTAAVGIAVPTLYVAWGYVGLSCILGGPLTIGETAVVMGGVMATNVFVGDVANLLGQAIDGLAYGEPSWSAGELWDMTSEHLIWGASTSITAPPSFLLSRLFWERALLHPISAGREAIGVLGPRWDSVVRSRWYLRWAPVPLGIGYGFGRTQQVAEEQEEFRMGLRPPVPPSVRKLVEERVPSLAEGIEIIHLYPHDAELMELLFPKLYHQVVTPEGALVLTHAVLEAISLNPALSTPENGT